MILVIDNGAGGYSIIHEPSRLGKSEEELSEIGVLLESMPEAENIDGKTAILKFDGERLYYEYVNNTLTEMQVLNNKIDNAIIELTTLIAMGGM